MCFFCKFSIYGPEKAFVSVLRDSIFSLSYNLYTYMHFLI